jgi:hypothetical protein
VPLLSLPGLVGSGSATVSAASPAVLVTTAGTEAVYSAPTPGVSAPIWAGPPSVNASTSGTSAPTVWSTVTLRCSTTTVNDLLSVPPLPSLTVTLAVYVPGVLYVCDGLC